MILSPDTIPLYQAARFASGPHAPDLAKGAGTLLGSNVKNFIEAKFDFVDRMLEWSGCGPAPGMVGRCRLSL